MCGKDNAEVRANIEGVTLSVCKNCSRFGKILGRIRIEPPKSIKTIKKQQAPAEEEPTERIVDEYSTLIKSKREKLNLKQEDLAKNIAEKESLLQKVESGHITPSIALARKLEKFLNIKLVEEYKEEKMTQKKSKSEGFTLGDFIKKR